MPYCPKCSCPLEVGETECPKCSATFGPNSARVPTVKPSGPVPPRPSDATDRPQLPPNASTQQSEAAPAQPAFLSALNAAIALGFLISVALPVDFLVGLVVDTKALGYIPPLERAQLRIVVEYIVPSALTYFVVRRMPLSGIQVFGLAVFNAVLIGCVAIRYSLIGRDLSMAGSFIQLGLVAVSLPMLAASFAILATAYFRWQKALQTGFRAAPSAVWATATQMSIVVLIGLVPLAYLALRFNVGDNAPRSMLLESKSRLETLCKDIWEKRYTVPASVRGVYLENQYVGSGDFAYILLRSRQGPVFVEVPNRLGAKSKYLRQYRESTQKEEVNELLAEYGVFHPEILNERDKQVGLAGVEIVVKDLRNNSTIGELRYYANNKTKELCVPRPARSANGPGISQALFILWALGLVQ